MDELVVVLEEYDANMSFEDLKTQWENDEPLRKGFGYNFEGFRAYMQYHRKGMSSK
ncbi:MAG: hypothetical protein ACYSTS_18490 [Planctomycetota bacterium]